jgi:hypothetical protein
MRLTQHRGENTTSVTSSRCEDNRLQQKRIKIMRVLPRISFKNSFFFNHDPPLPYYKHHRRHCT